MSYVSRVMTALHPNAYYRASDVASVTGIDQKECSRILKMLSENGVVERCCDDQFRRRKVYKTRQNRLPI